MNKLEFLLNLMEQLSNEHHFDNRSDKCKACDAYNICNTFYPIIKRLAESNIALPKAIEIFVFLDELKQLYVFNKTHKNAPLNDDSLTEWASRLNFVKSFQYYDELNSIITNKQSLFIKSIITETNIITLNSLQQALNEIRDNGAYIKEKLK